MDNIPAFANYLRMLHELMPTTETGNCPDCDTDTVHDNDCPRAANGDWDRPFNVIVDDNEKR